MDVDYYILCVGYIAIVYILFECLTFLWVMLRSYGLTSIGFVKDLRKYGEWVIVTGATDGIGKEYARQLAKQGFKIVLISRTKSKLEKLSKEIEDEFHVETKIISFDFTRTVDYTDIEKVVAELDIGILVNNVGMATGKVIAFDNSDISGIRDLLYCNMFSDVQMTHMVLKGMVDRQRGCIIHLSSASIFISIPYNSIYPSTKIFMDRFCKSLQLEYSGIIDHQLVTPGYVSTNMSKMKPGFTVPTAEDYVMSAIRTIGIRSTTCGYLSHEILRVVLLSIPHLVLVYTSKWFVLNVLKKLKKQ